MSMTEAQLARVDLFIKKMRDFNRNDIAAMSIRNEELKENEIFINKYIQNNK